MSYDPNAQRRYGPYAYNGKSDSEPTPDYECNYCRASSRDEPKLARRAGRACPFCGEGVIQLVED